MDAVQAEGGKRRYRETGDDGAILYEVEESDPPTRMVTRIADPSLPFGGRWTCELHAVTSGTTLRITEDGEVYNPLFRFMSRFVFGHYRTMDGYLRDLAARVEAGWRCEQQVGLRFAQPLIDAETTRNSRIRPCHSAVSLCVLCGKSS